MPPKTIYASFIGINAYPQNALYGCIKDVLSMDFLLQEWCSQQTGIMYKPLFLLAPHDSDTTTELFLAKGSNSFYEAPTFDNITTKAFAHLKAAVDGDVCILYYSGHGSQMPAPPEFWHSKPDKQSETLVCVDSRTTARDLVDKELAYLLWDALEGKEVHCLVVMDSCHSGNNTRALIEDEGLRSRHQPATNKSVALQRYIGYNDPRNLYSINNGQASVRIARYVHLAAARDDEKALESGGGLFTTKLMELLRSGGTKASYRSIVQTLATTVRSRNGKQNPVLFARDESDKDLMFLGGGMLGYRPSFEVRYDWNKEQWLMYGGALHSLIASTKNAKTLVEIGGVTATVIAVSATKSVLDGAGLDTLDKESENLKATLKQLAAPPLIIGVSKAVSTDATAMEDLKQSYSAAQCRFFTIDFSGQEDADYIIQQTSNGQWVLTQRGDDTPMFKREADAAAFMTNVDAVGKWMMAAALHSENELIGASDFDFQLESIEGQKITRSNIEDITGEKLTIQPGDELVFQYKEGHQPAFRLGIGVSQQSSLQQCYVGALYLESLFGINSNLIAQDANKLVKGGSPAKLSWQDGGREYHTLPLAIDEKYALHGVSEITAIVKIIVSEQPVSLDGFAQPSLSLDSGAEKSFRNLGFEEDKVEKDISWQVFTFKIRIVKESKEALLQNGTEVSFTNFTIKPPQGFTATVFAATNNDLQTKISDMRSRGLGAAQAPEVAAILPPASVWGNGVTETSLFGEAMSSFGDNSLAVLELMPQHQTGGMQIDSANPLVIAPKNSSSQTRSVADAEETVVPFGFDMHAGLYISLGYSDEAGNIYVQHLPPPTPGSIQGKETLDRSLTGSVKLFFKKILRNKKLNTLALWMVGQNGVWEQLTTDPQAMKPLLAGGKDAGALLLIHGIIGDTLDMCEAIRQMEGLSDKIKYLLTYDYENLSTPVDQTAKALQQELSLAGFETANAPQLTILAHSMGGLVARWLVELEGGDAFTKQLIMAGTPNGGSEMARAILSVEGLITHALNVTGPIKYALTGLSFLAKKLGLNPLQALSGLQPGSGTLQKLMAAGRKSGVMYTLLCGDTTLLKSGYDGNDPFLQKLSCHLMNQVVYPALNRFLYEQEPNDLAVRVASMKALALTGEDTVQHLPCDHLTYFGLKEMKDALL